MIDLGQATIVGNIFYKELSEGKYNIEFNRVELHLNPESYKKVSSQLKIGSAIKFKISEKIEVTNEEGVRNVPVQGECVCNVIEFDFYHYPNEDYAELLIDLSASTDVEESL